jgi:hypothetical protein
MSEPRVPFSALGWLALAAMPTARSLLLEWVT